MFSTALRAFLREPVAENMHQLGLATALIHSNYSLKNANTVLPGGAY